MSGLFVPLPSGRAAPSAAGRWATLVPQKHVLGRPARPWGRSGVLETVRQRLARLQGLVAAARRVPGLSGSARERSFGGRALTRDDDFADYGKFGDRDDDGADDYDDYGNTEEYAAPSRDEQRRRALEQRAALLQEAEARKAEMAASRPPQRAPRKALRSAQEAPAELEEEDEEEEEEEKPLTTEDLLQTLTRRTLRKDEVLDTVAQLREGGFLRTAEDYEVVLKVLGKRKSKNMWLEALRVWEDMRSGSLAPGIEHFNHMISAYRFGGQWERALATFQEELSGGAEVNVRTFLPLIGACGEGNQWQRSLDLLGEMARRGVAPSLASYSAAISACEKSAVWEKAVALLGQAIDEGLEPDVRVYTAAIGACQKGQVDRVQELLEDMWERSISPNTFTYNAVIRAAGEAGKWREALELQVCMQEEKLEPDVATYNALIGACAGSGMWELAIAELEHMRRNTKLKPNLNTFMTLADACEAARKGSASTDFIQDGRAAGLGIEALEGMRRKGFMPTKSAFRAAILDSQDAGRWQQMLVLLGEMCSAGHVPGVLEYKAFDSASRTVVSSSASKRLRQVAKALDPEEEKESFGTVTNKKGESLGP